MTLLRILSALFISLPEIVQLLKHLQAAQDDAATASKIKADMGKINDAFKNKDASALNDIFKS